MTENEITGDILDVSIKLHRQFGAGLLESVYETLLEIELKKRGHKVERQKIVSFEYEGVLIENAFRLDMLVDDKVIVELKSTEKMSPVFAKQLKTYLAITKLQVGVVVNFGMTTFKDGFLRFVNNYSEPGLCASPLLGHPLRGQPSAGGYASLREIFLPPPHPIVLLFVIVVIYFPTPPELHLAQRVHSVPLD